MSEDKQKLVICPYCGHTQKSAERCESCGGFFEPLSRMATQIAMGPWFIRDTKQPFRPGCSFDVLEKQIKAGRIKPTTVMRGPTTKQFWTIARNVPGVAHLLGYCDMCGAHVRPNAADCGECGQSFITWESRNELGLQFADDEQVRRAQRYLDMKVEEQAGKSKKKKEAKSTDEATASVAAAASLSPDNQATDLLSEVIGQSNVADGEDAGIADEFEAGSDLLSFEKHHDDDPAAALAAATDVRDSGARPSPPLPPQSSNTNMILILVISNAVIIGVIIAFAVLMNNGDNKNNNVEPPAIDQPDASQPNNPSGNQSNGSSTNTNGEMTKNNQPVVNPIDEVPEPAPPKVTFDPNAELPPALADAKELLKEADTLGDDGRRAERLANLEAALSIMEQYLADTPRERQFEGVEKVISDVKSNIAYERRIQGIDTVLDPTG